MPPTIPTQAALVAREATLAAEATAAEKARAQLAGDIEDPRAGQLAIRADRLARYAAFIAAYDAIPEALTAWADRMAEAIRTVNRDRAAQEKPALDPETCPIHQVRVPWLTALLIVLYGEHEYFWPATLGEREVARAAAWAMGRKRPAGVPIEYGGAGLHLIGRAQLMTTRKAG